MHQRPCPVKNLRFSHDRSPSDCQLQYFTGSTMQRAFCPSLPLYLPTALSSMLLRPKNIDRAAVLPYECQFFSSTHSTVQIYSNFNRVEIRSSHFLLQAELCLSSTFALPTIAGVIGEYVQEVPVHNLMCPRVLSEYCLSLSCYPLFSRLLQLLSVAMLRTKF
jgi:hypothetical protein